MIITLAAIVGTVLFTLMALADAKDIYQKIGITVFSVLALGSIVAVSFEWSDLERRTGEIVEDGAK